MNSAEGAHIKHLAKSFIGNNARATHLSGKLRTNMYFLLTHMY